ncbi:SDR family NAD(P)-dependent oxidoreductase [Paenibacillus sp. HN-1]|uniref:SDR family NAD(P)-dependent oxidoreductase n=1 Tax=Paenibacillus TaxID=44249 RepID=UPI001CA8D539|nr:MULTISPECIES: SDR family NAD(P)-dependent oxidoreductase [Paenibacillus]MBY9078581.1 SDR family NAD(P)-dependent oxidoreductase [Paenibacillus sp. CGMCC 1.18879]MBY9083205.1 SDR family NAD(P)-dependent oxidoreductase [Paenibacillus sinensis]
MKTIAIVGAGPGLGLSLAKKFGANGFKVALISRNQDKLSKMIEELGELHIEARAFVADVNDLAALKLAIQAAKSAFGSIEVLEFSPYAGWEKFTHVLETTPQSVLEQIHSFLLPAILSVNEVLPEMIQNGAGALLFTTGISAMHPLAMVGNGGIVMSGIRNYATNLHNELKEKGVFVGHLSIGTMIQAGTTGDPDVIAAAWYNLFEKKDHFEETFPLSF